MPLAPGLVMTVRGPVDGAALGITLPHEHLLMEADWPGLWPATSPRPDLVDRPVTMELLGLHRRDPFITRDNWRLRDVTRAAEELSHFRRAGGSTIVEASTIGLGRDPHRLVDISLATGVHIIAGAGWYIGPSHGADVVDASIDELRDRLIGQLETGLEQVAPGLVRAGVIGEIGTSGPLTATEERVLRAAVRAQRQTGVGLSIHLSSRQNGRTIKAIVALLDGEGANPRRVVLGHMCLGIARRYRNLAAKAGYGIEFDTFGYEGYYMLHEGSYASIWEEPRDSDRIRMILELLDGGYADQVFVSQDVANKMHLKAFGGYGYDHLLTNVAPMFERAGIDSRTLRRIMADNPRRLLATSFD